MVEGDGMSVHVKYCIVNKYQRAMTGVLSVGTCHALLSIIFVFAPLLKERGEEKFQ